VAYYIRVLTKSEQRVSVSALRRRLRSDGIPATIELESGTEERWEEALIRHTDAGVSSPEIAVLEWNPVEKGSLGEEETEEFVEEIQGCRPESAARWLRAYLPHVKAIYCLQILHTGADWGKGWDAIHAVQGELWGTLGGLLQADLEGFSNEDGYHILWQFGDDASGSWTMAVLDDNGKWAAFEMDLGNQGHRTAFLAGKVPAGVNMIG